MRKYVARMTRGLVVLIVMCGLALGLMSSPAAAQSIICSPAPLLAGLDPTPGDDTLTVADLQAIAALAPDNQALQDTVQAFLNTGAAGIQYQNCTPPAATTVPPTTTVDPTVVPTVEPTVDPTDPTAEPTANVDPTAAPTTVPSDDGADGADSGDADAGDGDDSGDSGDSGDGDDSGDSVTNLPTTGQGPQSGQGNVILLALTSSMALIAMGALWTRQHRSR